MRNNIFLARKLSRRRAAPPPATVSAAEKPAPSRSHPPNVERPIFSSIRSKIILPYFFLTILIAILGTFIVTRLIAGSLEERFVNQLLESARIAGDGVVRREDDNLESLRLMVFTEGVADALRNEDAFALKTLLEPLAANAQLDSVFAVSIAGQEVLGLQAVISAEGNIDYQTTQGQDLSGLAMVAPVLAGDIDEFGDKYIGLINMPAGMTMYTAGPVMEDGELVGAVLVGTNLERVLQQLKLESLADITFYASDGLPLASTFPGWNNPAEREILAVEPTLIETTIRQAESSTSLSEMELFERPFRVSYVPLVVRRDTLGMLGVALPSTFIFQAASTSRLTFVVLFSAASLLVVLVGFAIAQLIVRPVLRLVHVSQAIAEGDLTQRVGITPRDELGILAKSFDTMTDHLEARSRELQEEVARITAILSSIADGVVVRDTEGDVILMNEAAQTLFSNSSGNLSEYLTTLESTQDDQLEANDDGDLSQTYRLELDDRILSARTAPVYTDSGNLIGNVLVMRDVTREADAERLKDDFVNSVSHELRTPLTIIKGYADILKLGKQDVQDSTYRKAMNAIFQHSYSLERMITQLIDLSEMAAGTLALVTKPASLNELLDQILKEWDARFDEAGLTVNLNQNALKLISEIDERRLAWALDGIFQNACQHSPDGGTLDVTISRLESAAVLQIKDQGVGISGDDLPHVFKRFYRGRPIDPNGKLLDTRGLGQGLYVLQSIIEGHGGRVWVESKVGEGSEFSILLPLVQSKST